MISIDPGKHAGYAVFSDLTGILNECGLLYSTDRWAPGAKCIIERPTIYPHSPVPPNDIIALAITAGGIAAQFTDVKWILPRQWKGNLPKDVVGERILAKLTPEERALIRPGTRHDVIDAIGLGLWYLKRMRTGGV